MIIFTHQSAEMGTQKHAKAGQGTDLVGGPVVNKQTIKQDDLRLVWRCNDVTCINNVNDTGEFGSV